MTTGSREELAEAIWPSVQPTPTREIRCRHCARSNRVEVPSAVMLPEKHRCGACSEPLFLDAGEPLTGISSSSYEHSLDRSSLSALKSVPGFATLMRWVLKHVAERTLRIQLMSDSVLCSEEQFPELVGMSERACRSLDLSVRPTVFLGESPFMNAVTGGVDEPMIVVRSALLDQLDDQELLSVLGHELGHLHADHILYKAIAGVLLMGGMAASGLIKLLTWPLQRALLKWNRCSELTADRAGLLVCRDLGACIGVDLKLAGGNRPGTRRRTSIRLAPFIRQVRELAQMESSSLLDSTLAALITMGRGHPFAAWRVMHLMEWVERGSYLDILAGDYERVEKEES